MTIEKPGNGNFIGIDHYTGGVDMPTISTNEETVITFRFTGMLTDEEIKVAIEEFEKEIRRAQSEKRSIFFGK